MTVKLTDPWPSAVPWPGTPAKEHGFYPDCVNRAKALLRKAAHELVRGRPDKAFLLQPLITTLTVELDRFVQSTQRDQSEGYATPEARHKAMTDGLARMQAQERNDV